MGLESGENKKEEGSREKREEKRRNRERKRRRRWEGTAAPYTVRQGVRRKDI